MRKLVPVVAVAVIAGSIAAYFAFQSRPDGIQSLRAYVSGAPLEIKVITPGRVIYIAPEGERIKAGELLLETDARRLLEQKQEVEKQIDDQARRLHPVTLVLFQNLAAIPESEEELSAELQAAEKELKIAEDRVLELSVRHASLQLDLHRLELKKGRIAEDVARLGELRAQDSRQGQELSRARDYRDETSTRRRSLEKRLDNKKKLLAALAKLPADQQDFYSQARSQFDKLQEIERDIKLSKVSAPEDGIVIKTFARSGDEAVFGQKALLLASEKKDAFWVTAIFDAEFETDLKAGAPCAVSIIADDNPQFRGRLAERLPELENEPGKIVLKVILAADDAAMLSKLQTRQEAVVTLTEQD